MRKTGYEKKIVAFIDILGFKNIVENTDKAFSIIEIVSEIKKSKKEFIKEMSAKEIEVTWFSDCIVVSAPLDIYYVDFILDIIQQMQCELIKNKVLIRGGIEIGDCFHKGEKLFGPAMNEAYRLESKIATVPRIVLSKELIKYIKESQRIEEKHQEDNFTYNLEVCNENELANITEYYISEVTIASQIFERLIIKDDDGYYFINYLDEIIYTCIHTASYEKEIIKSHDGTIVDTSYQAFKEICESWYIDIIEPIQNFIKENLKGNDMNVLLKYVWVKDYYNRCLESYKSDLSDEFESDFYWKLFV
ncbi:MULTISPECIES: hypothetical protein [unclassified Lysinibacillus]|uniref:adenylate/guanylate cyclase domain-containing protein n=1 Tax=unclassified Lysinibacillus TaxID=2636778 RepID=UPI0020125F82|nr:MULTISPECIES: hypothetical protein [unclassified Lysinibacillus]MCL1700608.1 hypothetical protein [Lysinibacillus sp. Bpr_S20]MDD1504733.1 hypothetical protein [Lysinibacillus sp. CNPSo 3705]